MVLTKKLYLSWLYACVGIMQADVGGMRIGGYGCGLWGVGLSCGMWRLRSKVISLFLFFLSLAGGLLGGASGACGA